VKHEVYDFRRKKACGSARKEKAVANMTLLAVNIIAIETKLTKDKYAHRYRTP
jgi:hypothetical protein